MFQHENAHTVAKAGGRRAARTTTLPRRGEVFVRAAAAAPATPPSLAPSPWLPPQVSETAQGAAVCLLLDRFRVDLPAGGYDFAFMDFLRELYREHAIGSCLWLATEAFAAGYFAGQTAEGRSRSRKRAKLLYGTALQSMNRALSDPARAVEDGTIGAVLILGIYEVGPGLSSIDDEVCRQRSLTEPL
jgi:hypothetical protein